MSWMAGNPLIEMHKRERNRMLTCLNALFNQNSEGEVFDSVFNHSHTLLPYLQRSLDGNNFNSYKNKTFFGLQMKKTMNHSIGVFELEIHI